MRGRRPSTGRFDSREELEAWVWHFWTHTPACIADVARQCRVSPGVVSKILDKGRPV